MWHFVVCDDEEEHRKLVTAELHLALKGLHVSDMEYDVCQYSSLAELRKRDAEPAVLLLDIAFENEEDGMRAAAQLRQRWRNMHLIYISSLHDRIGESFDAYAIGYVVKKDLKRDLKPAIARAVYKLQEKDEEPVSVRFKVGRGVPYQVYLPEILYIKMEDRHLKLYTASTSAVKPFSYLGTIRGEAERLKKYGLVRVHKSLIINPVNIQRVIKPRDEGSCYILMNNGDRLDFNRKNYNDICLVWEDAKENEHWNMSFCP